MKCWSLSHVQLFAILGTVAHQAPLPMGISKNTGMGCHSLLQGVFPTYRSRVSYEIVFPWLNHTINLYFQKTNVKQE